MPFECDVCHQKHFKTPAALGSHKRSSGCADLWSDQAPAEPDKKKLKAAVEAKQAAADAIGNAAREDARAPAEEEQRGVELPAERIEKEAGEGSPAGPSCRGDEAGGAREQSFAAGGSYFSDPVGDPEASRFLEVDEETRETLKLVEFIRHCRNNVGLPQEDVKRLIDLLFFKDFDLSKVKVRSPQDIKKFEEKVLFSQDDGWTTIDVSKEGDPYPILLRMRDPIEILKELLAFPANSEGFAYGPRRTEDAQGRRTVSDPETATWWAEAQAHINAKYRWGSIIAALILYSDATTLSNDMRTHGWPLVLSLANIAVERRNEEGGHALGAIFPILHAVPGHPGFEPNSPEFTLRRLQVFQDCLKRFLQPLKDASFDGFVAEDPNGDDKYFYPLLYAYICDHPEGCKVTCTKDTNQTNAPCSLCMCSADELHEVGQHYYYRTPEGMRWGLEQITKAKDAADKEQWEKGLSLHPVECALWGFNGEKTTWGNPYRAVHVDMMHQTDLGIFPTMCDAIVDVVAGSNRTAKARAIEAALRDIKENFRFADLRVPGSDKGGYFTSASRSKFAAFEHRAVMQVIVPALVGLLSNDVLSAVVEFLDWVVLACRVKEHTEDSLTAMERQGEKAIRLIVRHLGEGQASGFRLIKVHMMSHYRDCIWRSGIPIHYSTNLFESLHIQLLKIGYRASNRRDAMDQVLHHHRRLCLLRKHAGLPNPDEEEEEEEDSAPEFRGSALQQAMRADPRRNVLSAAKLNLRLPWLEHVGTPDADPAGGPSSSKYARELLEDQPEVRQLAGLLRSFLGSDYERVVKNVVSVHGALALPSGDTERFGPRAMYARAVPRFHGRPWYSDVAIQGEAPGRAPVDLFAHAHLFLSCQVADPRGGEPRRHEMALVRFYKELPKLDKVTRCVQLKWGDLTRGGAYKLVDAANVLRAVHVVPRNDLPEIFFINPFLFAYS